MKPRFLPTCRVDHRPKMPFHRYARKHYLIGYHSRYARLRLKESGDALMDWSRRGRMLSRMWSYSGLNPRRTMTLASAVACYLIERIGRTAARVMGSLPGHHEILALRVDAVGQPELMCKIVAAAEQRQGLWISYANAWTLVQARRSTAFRGLLNSADICYPDGLGVGVTSVLLRRRWLAKVTAEDFIFDLCEELANRDLTIAIIGAQKNIAVRASQRLTETVPSLRIVLVSSGHFATAEEQTLSSDLLQKCPDIVLVGMGQPRQEEWVARTRRLLPQTLFWCVGGLFDYLVGPKKSADFARQFGLEWFQKLCHSPRSMWRRYLLGIPALFGYIFAEHATRIHQVFSIRLSKTARRI